MLLLSSTPRTMENGTPPKLLKGLQELKPPDSMPRWKRTLAWGIIGGTLGLAIAGGIFVAFLRDLPGLPSIDNGPAQSLATKIYDVNGALITQLAVENRTLVELNQIPENLKNAFIALEDQHFYSHWGIDVEGLIRASWVNLMHGKTIQGGSTITQQLAKNVFLTPERTMGRKVKEALLSLQIERAYTKDEILHMYFNHIYFGH